MTKEEFEKYNKKYANYIYSIIDENHCFYPFVKSKIRWAFVSDDNIRNVACCDKKTNIIKVNLNAVVDAYENNEPLVIEYFIIHEIRHIFQHEEIARLMNKEKTFSPISLVEEWKKNEEHYIRATDNSEDGNAGYYLQPTEKDAYVFAYAVMSYKYKFEDIKDLFVPPVYSDWFNLELIRWHSYFANKGIKPITK